MLIQSILCLGGFLRARGGVRKHIGDYTLFLRDFSGVFRQPRRSVLDYFVDYVKLGRSMRSSQFDQFESRVARSFAGWRRISSFVYTRLNRVRDELRQMEMKHYQRFERIQVLERIERVV
jgi:hypothetical protein